MSKVETETRQERERRLQAEHAERVRKERENTEHRRKMREEGRKVRHELSPIHDVLFIHNGEPFVDHSHSGFTAFTLQIGRILEGVHRSIIQPVSYEFLKELGDNYSEAVAWFREYGHIEPFIIRWGNTLLFFDQDYMPPVVKRIAALIEVGQVQPLHPTVTQWLKDNPERIPDLFSAHQFKRMFLVWVQDQPYIIDRERLPVEIAHNYLPTWEYFNEWKAWTK